MIVAFYGRVSTDEQAERGNIGSQVDFAQKYFDLHGPAAGIDNFVLYLDEGVSGTIALQERPGAAQMMAAGRAGKIKAVYVYRLDRLARSTIHVLSAFEYFNELGIAVKSMTEAFDTGTSSGKFFMTMLASIAALERDTILERTQLGKERAVAENRWTSGQPPFGFCIGPDKRLEINEGEAATVRLIFKLYGEGMSTVPIAQYLNARGISTPALSRGLKVRGSGSWGAGHISIILRNRAYIGEYCTMRRSKRHREGRVIKVPALVGREQFAGVNILLNGRADTARGNRGRQYILRGLLYCGHCGRAYIGSSSGGKVGSRVYYRCSGAVNRGQGKVCRGKMFRASLIEGAVWDDIKGFLCSPGRVLEVLENYLGSFEGAANTDSSAGHGVVQPKNKQWGKPRLAAQEMVSQGLEPEGLKLLGLESQGLQPQGLQPQELEFLQRELQEIDKELLEKQYARERVLSLVAKNIVSFSEAERELLNLAGHLETLKGRREVLCHKVESERRLSGRALGAAIISDYFKGAALAAKPEDMAEIIRALVKKIVVFTQGDLQVDGGERELPRVCIEYYFDLHCGLRGV